MTHKLRPKSSKKNVALLSTTRGNDSRRQMGIAVEPAGCTNRGLFAHQVRGSMDERVNGSDLHRAEYATLVLVRNLFCFISTTPHFLSTCVRFTSARCRCCLHATPERGSRDPWAALLGIAFGFLPHRRLSATAYEGPNGTHWCRMRNAAPDSRDYSS